MTLNSITGNVWSRLRATRSDPPAAAAGNRKRRETYVFALEQAEQMFRAAAVVGPATRPLLVFYGLSQAGRAIAAAAADTSAAGGWEMSSHGILPVELRDPLPDIKVYADGNKGSFVRLSHILGSPIWGKDDAVRLAQLWDTVPENRTQPIVDDERSRRTVLRVHGDRSFQPHPLASALVSHFPPWLAAEASGQSLREFMAAYPTASGYSSYVRTTDHPDGPPAYGTTQDGWANLPMHWEAPQGREATWEQRNEHLGSMMHLFERGRVATGVFVPVVGANTTSQHPLMAWWAVTFTLSMLARYQPAEWATHIDVDRSRTAVPIEQFLASAIDALPRLILQTIQEVA
ncbi:hypothetical protein AB0B94_30845 [Micromonospora sp. NPDC048986]|uniref:YaaC family protein n=1 Tax=Micromonospora sp. NPDC048986 TaxID=3155644 RepID=UPI0033C03320